MRSKTRTCASSVLLLALAGQLCAAELSLSDQELTYKVTAPTIVGALIQFSQQSGLQLLYPSDGTTALSAPRVEGTYTAKAALHHLLENSGLTFEFVNERTILVRRSPPQSANAPYPPRAAVR